MKKILRVALVLVVLVLLLGGGVFVWASMRVSSLRSEILETHAASFPVPFPLTAAERAELPAGTDPDEVALARAVERGEHLVSSRYACGECHGTDFAGGVMIDDPMLGSLLGPNLTSGPGSKTLDYEAADWDRAVRHGVRPDGTRSAMPAIDFMMMSDQELSDIVAYLGSLPPVDAAVPEVRFGPVGRILVATGQLPFSADAIEHNAPHAALPPSATVSVEFGRHLAGVCVGCHGPDLAGGPVVGGDPSWPPARNLTPHVDGLAGWTLADFRRVLLQATRPDGTPVQTPMDGIVPFAENMSDVEIEALWTYLQSLPPEPTPR